MIKDQFSDMLARIQNATAKNHNAVYINYTNFNIAFLKTLVLEKYIQGYSVYSIIKPIKIIKIFLLYKGWWIKKPTFRTLKKISKTGYPQFARIDDLKKRITSILWATKVIFISTSSGIMTVSKAVTLGKGGKLLCILEK